MKKSSAFTLIELLVVLATVSILISITIPRFHGMRDEGNIAKAKTELRTIQDAVEAYALHNARTYPEFLSQLTLVKPTLLPRVPDDPYGTISGCQNQKRPYRYVRGGNANNLYVIYSMGPGRNGLASIDASDNVSEINAESCIYVSNIHDDTKP